MGFIHVTVGCFALSICAVFFNKDIATIIASAAAWAIEFSIALLKLPKIVAEYLFDKSDVDEFIRRFVTLKNSFNQLQYYVDFHISSKH